MIKDFYSFSFSRICILNMFRQCSHLYAMKTELHNEESELLFRLSSIYHLCYGLPHCKFFLLDRPTLSVFSTWTWTEVTGADSCESIVFTPINSMVKISTIHNMYKCEDLHEIKQPLPKVTSNLKLNYLAYAVSSVLEHFLHLPSRYK